MKPPRCAAILALLVLLVLLAGVGLHAVGWKNPFASVAAGLDFVRAQAGVLQAFRQAHPLGAIFAYAGTLLVCAATGLLSPSFVALGGAVVLGFGAAFAIAWPLTALAALAPFMLARLCFRRSLERRLPGPLGVIRRGVARDGAFYLFSLRLLPMVPFTTVSVLSGITPLRASTFFLVTMLGRLPATLLYCNAGAHLAMVRSSRDLLSPGLCLSLVALALAPYACRRLLRYRRGKSLTPVPAVELVQGPAPSEQAKFA